MRHNTIHRCAVILSASAALALGCGAQDAQSQDGAVGGAGAVPGGGAGGGGFGNTCPDCKALGEGVEDRASVDDATQYTGTGAAGGQSAAGVAPTCAGVNNTEKRLESALGSSSSLASATLTRGLIAMGKVPLPQHVRTQDVLNYFPPSFATTNTPASADESAPRIVVELAARAAGQFGDENGTTDYDLLVAVQAPTPKSITSPDVLIVLDTTPSMATGLERAKAAAATLLQKLPETSSVSLRSSDSTTDLHAPAGAPRDQILEDLQEIAPLEAERPFAQTLSGAYAQAELEPGSRVFVFTDGADDPLTISPDAIELGASEDIVLNAFSVAPPDQHGDRFFRALAWLGRGHYAFLDTDQEAESVLSQRLPAMLNTELRDVRVALSLPWHLRNVPRETEQIIQFGQGNKPQNLGPAAVSSFLYHLRTCDSTLVNVNASDTLTVTVRYKRDGDEFSELPLSFELSKLLAAEHQRVVRAAAIHTYAESLKTLDVLRLLYAQERLTNAVAATGDATLVGLSALLSQHPLLLQP